MGMKFNSQICTTREQSERLIALGLKKETADMAQIENWDYDLKDGKFFTGEYFERPIDYVEGMTGHYIPAWSLHRLLSLIPKNIEFQVSPMYGRNYTLPIELQITCELDICYIELNREEFKGFYGTDIYDSAIRCIEWLIKEGYFNKEYLV